MKFLKQRFNTGNIGEYPKVIQDLIHLHHYHCHMRYWQQPSPKIFFFIDEADPEAQEFFIEQYTPGYDSLVIRDHVDPTVKSLLEKAINPTKSSISALTIKKKAIERKTSPLVIIWGDQYEPELNECICSWFKQSEVFGITIDDNPHTQIT